MAVNIYAEHLGVGIWSS